MLPGQSGYPNVSWTATKLPLERPAEARWVFEAVAGGKIGDRVPPFRFVECFKNPKQSPFLDVPNDSPVRFEQAI
jgi:hypothetical protein